MTTDLTQLETLLKEATPGPWIAPHEFDNGHEIVTSLGNPVCGSSPSQFYGGGFLDYEDRNLAIALRNAAPDLIAEIKRLREANENMLDTFQAIYEKLGIREGEVPGTEKVSDTVLRFIQNEWLDISTAPKDGTKILVLGIGGNIFLSQWDDDRYAKHPKPYWPMPPFGITRSRSTPPTHWKPLPKPPKV